MNLNPLIQAIYKEKQMCKDYIRLENKLMYLYSTFQCNVINVSNKYKNI